MAYNEARHVLLRIKIMSIQATLKVLSTGGHRFAVRALEVELNKLKMEERYERSRKD